MKKYRLVVTDNVWNNLAEITQYITSVASENLAMKYTDQLLDEIRELSNPLLADAMHFRSGKQQSNFIHKQNA